MLLACGVVGVLAFWAGWVLKDQKWKRAAFNKRVMVVDGEMYQVKQYTPPEEEEK